MNLIPSLIVWTCTKIPVETTIESPSGVYNAKQSSPISVTIGDAAICNAVSLAETNAPLKLA